MQPPLSSARSYTRPIQSSSGQQPSNSSHATTSLSSNRRPSSQVSHRDESARADWDPRSSMRGEDGLDQSTVKEEWAADEEAMLSLYGLSSLAPERWEETGDGTGTSGDPGLFGETGAAGTAKIAGVVKGDETDPLGLIRGGVLANNPDISSDMRSSVLLHSKTFDPKVFLSTVHPNATFKDLNYGREKLKENLEQRSGALKLLVEAEWDRFVGVKATTETVFEEMKHSGGPLEPTSDYGVKEIRETLKHASSRAETVFQPILDARTKADRLKSTLGVFERSKFFFNLPNILGEAVEAGKYDVALSAYKKGRYILSSRPAQLLGLPVPTTQSQQLQQKRIYEKVWGQVEKIVGDLRATLGKRLRDSSTSKRSGLEEVEKTIEILLELDPTDDPVWIFFDTNHRQILHLLKSSAESSTSRFRVAMDQYGHEARNLSQLGGGDHAFDHRAGRDDGEEEETLLELENDRLKMLDLKTSVEDGLESLESVGERIREHGLGREVWTVVYELVRNLNEVVLSTLPGFWKVAKGYMEGKYQKKSNSTVSSAAQNARRSPTQCRVMTQDIINLYVSLLSSFFTLSSSTTSSSSSSSSLSQNQPTDLSTTPPMPPFVPPIANATTNAHFVLKILNEMQDCANELGALELTGEATASLKELIASAKWRFEEVICSGWVRDAKIFYRLETWKPDSSHHDGPASATSASTSSGAITPTTSASTSYLRKISAFHRFNVISAYKVAGGSEERAQALLGSSSSTSSSSGGGTANPLSNSRTRHDIDLPVEFQRKVQGAFLDGLYAFLDGLVHVAFSDPDQVSSGSVRKDSLGGANEGGEEETGRPKEVDVKNVDIRILLTVSNLTHLRESIIPRMISQFQTAFKVDMSQDAQMLMEVTDQLDKILFDDYVKRKSAEVGEIIRKGVLGGGIDWYEAEKPKEVHPFIYDALLSLVLVHAQVSATAKPLVARTLGSLVEELAGVALEAFGQVERFGMGGMLQATLEIEFMHQTLSQHVSPTADQTLQSIYKTISQSYYRRPTPNSAAELQQELEGLKRTLVASRRATALQFLCFRRPSKAPSAPQTTSGKVIDGAGTEGASRRGAVVAA
ncbi:exocyst subunit SEC5 [Sporobolomyces salmoneus]|uniref:exocyst subunit SEC5 n=1 Tax=Sporobolomyces salmoneus TaxID=183962 RepID=UPI003174CC31